MARRRSRRWYMLKVVVLSRNITNLAKCVEAIVASEPTLSPSSIIVVDDDETGQIAHSCEMRGPTRLQGIKPFIFSRNANLGLSTAFEEAEEVVLINDDALLRTYCGFSLMQSES